MHSFLNKAKALKMTSVISGVVQIYVRVATGGAGGRWQALLNTVAGVAILHMLKRAAKVRGWVLLQADSGMIHIGFLNTF